jgi:type 1 glutamine amidotransferase
MLRLLLVLMVVLPAAGEAASPRRILLIGAPNDTHPRATHEYMAAMRLLDQELRSGQDIEPVITQADSAWPDGPVLLDRADVAVIFLTEGARWLVADPARRAAFERLAERGGGLVCLHWGMGTKPVEPIEPFVNLFGACHGSPDRKYRVLTTRVRFASDHPLSQGLAPVEVEDEFYYRLKTTRLGQVTPVAWARIDDADEMVAWAWERPAGGRSFGFSGLHYHRNWDVTEYRQLVLRGILWTADGVPKPAAAENR